MGKFELYPGLGAFQYSATADELRTMAEKLEAHPNGARAAADTRRILKLAEGLADVWREQAAFEWNDHNNGSVIAELDRYNAANPTSGNE